MEKSLNPDARKLEEAFFAKENQRLLETLKERANLETRRENLRSVVQTDDDALLDHLLNLGIGPETALALTLLPLAVVAWADGRIEPSEREAVLSAAKEQGVTGPALQLLESWLARKPGPILVETWKRYVQSLWAHLDEEHRTEMRQRTIGRAHQVAEASGGFLGLTSKVSAAEREVLADLEGALG